jgi:hypothetical protein
MRGRLVALWAGCLLVVVVGEVAVRLLGAYARLQAAPRRQPMARQGAGKVGPTILCIGESTTFLGGASSYPSLLQRELDTRLPSSGVTVVNAGRPGVDTRIIVQHLEEDLMRYHPVLVVAMMGNNDKGDQVAFAGGAKVATVPAIRLLRLSEYLKTVLEQKQRGGPAPDAGLVVGSPAQAQAVERAFALALDSQARENPAQIDEAFRKAIALTPDAPFLKAVLADILLGFVERGRREYLQPIKSLLDEVVSAYPHYPMGLIALALWHHAAKQPDQARLVFHRACLESWNGDYIGSNRELHRLVELARLTREPLFAARLEELCASNPNKVMYPTHASAYFAQVGDQERAQRYQAAVESISRHYYTILTQTSYEALRTRLARERIGLLCLQYAGRSGELLKRMVGEHPGVWFTDTEQEFAQARQVHAYSELFTDHCYGDLGHGTALGNSILAQKVAVTITQQRLYDPQTTSAAFVVPAASAAPSR